MDNNHKISAKDNKGIIYSDLVNKITPVIMNGKIIKIVKPIKK